MASKKSEQQPLAAVGPDPNRRVSLEEAMRLAYGRWNAGQAGQAEHLCRQVLAAAPNHASALHLLGLMAHACGKPDLAIAYLTKACAAPEAPALFHSNLTVMCRQRGRLQEAEAAGRRAVECDPRNAETWNILGVVLQELGKLEESRESILRALDLKPDLAGAHSNLGNTLTKLGRLEAAAQCYAKALALNPNHADFHSNYAATLCELGRFDDALRHALRAIEINPRAPHVYAMAAMIDDKLGRKMEALRRIESAVELAPDNARLLIAKANALSALGRLEEAIRLAARAIQLKPEDGDGHSTLALLLRSVGRYDEALAAFGRAIPLLPQPGSAITNKALTLREMGRRAESLASFDEALKVQPSLAAAWFGRADFKTFKADDPDIAAMEKLLASGEAQAYDDRMRLHFALGKAYLDAKMATPAFRHLAEGNRMKRATFAFDGDRTARWMQAIAEAFPAKRFPQLQGSGAPGETSVFVLGMPRSGTTLVEQVLAAHPAVHGAGELAVMHRLVQREYGADRTARPYPDFVGLFRPEHLARVGSQYLAETVKLAPSAERIVDKMPANFLYIGLIHLALPGARIIHIRRDPLDTCLSCYTKLFTVGQDFSYDLWNSGATTARIRR